MSKGGRGVFALSISPPEENLPVLGGLRLDGSAIFSGAKAKDLVGLNAKPEG